MKRLLITIFAVGITILAAIPARAECRRVFISQPCYTSPSYYAPTYYAPSYCAPSYCAPPVVSTTFLQVPVPVYPVYGVGYGGGTAGYNEIQGLRDEINQLRRSLQQPIQSPNPVYGGGQNTPMAPAPMAPANGLHAAAYQNPALTALMTNTCAACHDGTGARDSNRKIKFLTDDGRSVADHSDLIRWKAFGLASSGEMPKGGKQVTPEQLQLLYYYAVGKPPPPETPPPAPASPK